MFGLRLKFFIISFLLETKICEKMFLVFAKQIIHDLVLSILLLKSLHPFIHLENLLDEIWKLVNLVSYISQERGSPWLDAFGIFHNSSSVV